MSEGPGVFDEVIEYPDPDAQEALQRLVGLDHVRDRLLKEASLVLHPDLLSEWSRRFYGEVVELVRVMDKRPPLFVFGGDVGSGKTAMAKSFGDAVAREHRISLKLFSLSLTARGTGAVGQMTDLITRAFAEIATLARPTGGGKSAVIFLIDEADALAQSREFAQMHHEDRAGVNALIRGIDGLQRVSAPVLVVMCTNRPTALDPAILRRSVATFPFGRPDNGNRGRVLERGLGPTGFTPEQIEALVEATGPRDGRDVGFTYSDMLNRLLPAVLLDAFPESKISFERAIQIAREMSPTPEFNEARE